MPERPPRQALRADAERNRQRILNAAQEVFAIQGDSLRMEDVARHAHVGKATLYRTFPTRSSLIDAMALEQVSRFRDRATDALLSADTLAALHDLLIPLEDPTTTGVAALSGLTAHKVSTDLAQVQREAMTALDDILTRAKTEGLIRPEVTSRHLTVFFTGIARSLTWPEIADPATYREYSTLIFNAIRMRIETSVGASQTRP